MTDSLKPGLAALIEGPHTETRRSTREALLSLGLEKADGLSRDAYRDLVLEWCRTMAPSGA